MRTSLIFGTGCLLGLAGAVAIMDLPERPAPPLPSDWSAMAEQAVRDSLATQRGPVAELREVAVFQYGREDERGVCGRLLPPGQPPSDIVARVVLERPTSGANPVPRVELFTAEGPGGLRAMYVARQRFCRDVHAPPEPLREPIRPAGPPVANVLPGAEPAASAPPAEAASSGRVQVATPANLRAGPVSGSNVLGVVPRGQVLQVFERAPGGWLKVGEAAPKGWIHASMTRIAEQ